MMMLYMDVMIKFIFDYAIIMIEVIFIDVIMFNINFLNLYILCYKIENLVYLNLVVIFINKIVFLFRLDNLFH